MNKIFYYFFIFILTSIIGWIIEIIFCSYKEKKLCSRGFLIGPYCPIYGFSSIITILTLQKYQNDYFILFCTSIIITSTVEYITSYVMEKLFNARWWDYSEKKFNINGRICLKNSIAFGFLAIILIKILYPLMNSFIKIIPIKLFIIITIIMMIIFVLDVIISSNIIYKFKSNVEVLRKDYSNEISGKVREFISKKRYTNDLSEKIKNSIAKKSFIFKRLVKAFPNYIPNYVKNFQKKKK